MDCSVAKGSSACKAEEEEEVGVGKTAAVTRSGRLEEDAEEDAVLPWPSAEDTAGEKADAEEARVSSSVTDEAGWQRTSPCLFHRVKKCDAF